MQSKRYIMTHQTASTQSNWTQRNTLPDRSGTPFPSTGNRIPKRSGTLFPGVGNKYALLFLLQVKHQFPHKDGMLAVLVVADPLAVKVLHIFQLREIGMRVPA